MGKNNNPLTVQASHSDERIRDFFRFHLMWKDSARIVFYLLSVVALLVGVILLVFARYESAFFSFFIAAAFLITRMVMVKSAVNSLVKKARPPASNYSLTFSDREVVYQDAIREAVYPLDGFKAVHETRKYYFLYLDQTRALIVPKDVLAPEEKEMLDGLLAMAGVKICKSRCK